MSRTPKRRVDDHPLTYARAGVDLSAGEEAVERIKKHVRTTNRPEVIGDLGGFAGLFAFDRKGRRDPVLVSSTDGVGTKALIAAKAKKYDTIGIDLVAMTVDDVAVVGAEPLFMLDYISVGATNPAMIEKIVAGVAEGCRTAGCALIGGEVSEHPDVIKVGEFDLVGFAVGTVERKNLLPKNVKAGDALVGFASPNLRSNGFSLARAALLDRDRRRLDGPAWRGARRTLARELLMPSVIYSPAMLELRAHVPVKAFAHVTGGGIPGNLARVLPDRCDALVRTRVWEQPRIFTEIQTAGDIVEDEMDRVFNRGIGMIAIVAAGAELEAVDRVRLSGHDAWVIGEVVAGRGQVHMLR